ncbi:conserved hypothetical protein [Vibrio chagasii]|nr:conserved hypothetical protein [Vibrio chagasii]CAH6873193.1 conserved hypothetical protein [Vibrio chagasii]CAH6891172.1 conserved hypothetical protein [Vibrio chagasii]CAH6912864.1 conserved hypothetical protein [Vibrio chagasii]CAH6956983.1 conserved hypothetical protein [Vibrio chagasii]
MYRVQIFNVVIGVVITFIMNVGISYLAMDNGYIVIGEPFLQKEHSLQPIEITNHSRDTLNNLQFVVPNDLDLQSILITKPLIIKELKEASSPVGQKLIELSGVIPQSTARLLFPISSGSSSCCYLLNSEDLRIATKRDSEVFNPVKSMLIDASLTTLIYGSIMLASTWWLSRTLKSDEKEYREALERIEKKSDKQDKSIDDLRLIYKRQRYVLLRRIKEYSKEIEFWRTAVRKQLLTVMSPEEVENKLLSVSKQLNTRSTHGNITGELDSLEESISLAEEVSEKIT